MASYNVNYLQMLLTEVCAKYGVNSDHYGLIHVGRNIDLGFSERYLYEQIFKRCEKSQIEGAAEISLNADKVESLSKHIGYHSFKHFVSSKSPDIHDSLLSMKGHYYSYLRMNNRQRAYILQSPVEIYQDDTMKKMLFLLNGPKRDYVGELSFVEGVVTVLMRSAEGKIFFHIYKLGKTFAPSVIQGTFSGTSMGNDPIAGRCLLIREENETEFRNQKHNIVDLENSLDDKDRSIAHYFKNYENNNLAINNPMSYNIEDLY